MTVNEKDIVYQSLIVSREAANWAFWSMIGTWFAGIATFLAVVLTLYISNRRPKPKLSGSISNSLFSNGVSSVWGVGVSVANLGHTPVIITSLTWVYNGKTKLLQTFERYSDQCPKKLEHGDSAFFYVRNDEYQPWAANLKETIVSQGGKVSRLKMQVTLATGDQFKIKPPKGIIQMIQESSIA